MGKIFEFKLDTKSEPLSIEFKEGAEDFMDYPIFSMIAMVVASRYFRRLSAEKKHEMIEEILEVFSLFFDFEREEAYTWVKAALTNGLSP